VVPNPVAWVGRQALGRRNTDTHGSKQATGSQGREVDCDKPVENAKWSDHNKWGRSQKNPNPRIMDEEFEPTRHLTPHKLRFMEPENNTPDTLVPGFLTWKFHVLPRIEYTLGNLMDLLQLAAHRYTQITTPPDEKLMYELFKYERMIGGDNPGQNESVVEFTPSGKPIIRYKPTVRGSTLEEIMIALSKLEKWGTNASDLLGAMYKRCEVLSRMRASYYVGVQELLKRRSDLTAIQRKLLDEDYMHYL